MNTFTTHAEDAGASRKVSGWKISILSVTIAAAMGLTGCETPGQTALAGAAAGAAIGGALHGSGHDAMRGAAIGAGAGYLAGRAVQHERHRAYRDGYYDASYRDGYDDRRIYSDRNGDRYHVQNGRRYYVD